MIIYCFWNYRGGKRRREKYYVGFRSCFRGVSTPSASRTHKTGKVCDCNRICSRIAGGRQAMSRPSYAHYISNSQKESETARTSRRCKIWLTKYHILNCYRTRYYSAVCNIKGTICVVPSRLVSCSALALEASNTIRTVRRKKNTIQWERCFVEVIRFVSYCKKHMTYLW